MRDKPQISCTSCSTSTFLYRVFNSKLVESGRYFLRKIKCNTLYQKCNDNIGFLTNRAGRNKIPYHEGNYSFPSGEAARERIIPQVVRNFIPTQAIGQESYSYEF